MRLDLFSKANIVIGIQSPGENGKTVLQRTLGSIESEVVRLIVRQRNTAPKSWRGRPNISGGYIEEAIPDPISNSEVKLFGADGTARATLWESRTLPG